MLLCPIKHFTTYCFSKILQDNKYNIFIAEIESNKIFIFFWKKYIFSHPCLHAILVGRCLSWLIRSYHGIMCSIARPLQDLGQDCSMTLESRYPKRVKSNFSLNGLIIFFISYYNQCRKILIRFVPKRTLIFKKQSGNSPSRRPAQVSKNQVS